MRARQRILATAWFTLRALSAAAALALIVLGVPWLLAESLGWPWPRPLPTNFAGVGPWLAIWRIDRAGFVMDLLGIIGWAYWFAFIRQLVVQIPGALADAAALARHAVPTGRARRSGPAASLVTVLLATVTISLLSARTPASAKSVSPLPSAVQATISAPAVPGARSADPDSRSQHVVVRGDTLWDIATAHLGDPQRWREIYDLNYHRLQSDGQVLNDPSLIQPGWVLLLPADVQRPLAAATSAATDMMSSATPARAVSVTSSSAPAATNPVVAHRNRTAVQLPHGGYVGIGLATSLAASLTLARFLRRSRTTARWPIPLDTPQPEPAAPIAVLERAHLTTLSPPRLGYIQDGDLVTLDEDDDPYLTSNEPDIVYTAPSPSRAPHRSGLTGPSIPAAFNALEVPGSTAFGIADGREINLNLRSTPGLGLTGAGRLNAARAMLVGILASGGPVASLDHMRVLVPSRDLALLLDDFTPAVARLDITADLDEALDLLEAEYLERRQEFANLELANAADVRRFIPDQTMEPIVLIASPEAATTPRLAALLAAGQTADVHAILLGDWSTGTTVKIDDVGRSHSDDGHFDGADAFSLSCDEARAILTELGAPALATHPLTPPETEDHEPHNPEALPHQREADEAADQPTPRLVMIPSPTPAVVDPPDRPRVSVNVLGPVTITVDGREIRTRNLVTTVLAYLTLHPDGVTRDQILADLWTTEDGTNKGSGATMRTTLKDARIELRKATGNIDPIYIGFHGDRYTLNPDEVATDISQFNQHLADANQARTDPNRIQALEAAIDRYRGPLATGINADWLIVEREAESRRYTDACCRLSDLIVETHPESALQILERALADAAMNQELYAKIMCVQARLGRLTEMWKTLRLLEVRYAALGDEPDRNLYDLAERLTTRPRLRMS